MRLLLRGRRAHLVAAVGARRVWRGWHAGSAWCVRAQLKGNQISMMAKCKMERKIADELPTG